MARAAVRGQLLLQPVHFGPENKLAMRKDCIDCLVDCFPKRLRCA